jgi:hypothetical protein
VQITLSPFCLITSARDAILRCSLEAPLTFHLGEPQNRFHISPSGVTLERFSVLSLVNKRLL